MDIGIWILSDRAVEVLMKRSLKEGTNDISYYDLYSDYGLALGEHPQTTDDEVNKLSVAILSLPSGEFYHFGTSRELISSTLAIQDKVRDQRRIMHRKVKPNPAIFIQNSFTQVKLSAENANLWIENSHVGEGWEIRFTTDYYRSSRKPLEYKPAGRSLHRHRSYGRRSLCRTALWAG